MFDISKFLKYFLLLTLLNINSSLFMNEENSNENCIINLAGLNNNITNMTINDCIDITLNFSYYENKDLFFSLLIIDGKEDSMKFDTYHFYSLYQTKLNKDYLNGNKGELKIYKHFKDNITVEIINIMDTEDSRYYEMDKDGDNKDGRVDKKNFVRFIKQNDKNINANIKFKKEFTGRISYAIVRLASDDFHYIPRVDNFPNEKIESKYFDEVLDVSISIDNPYKNCTENIADSKRGKLALIVSLYGKANDIGNYFVIINKKRLNVFLIVSICFASIFAVIVFFLIKRKINATNKSNLIDDTCEKKQKELIEK